LESKSLTKSTTLTLQLSLKIYISKQDNIGYE